MAFKRSYAKRTYKRKYAKKGNSLARTRRTPLLPLMRSVNSAVHHFVLGDRNNVTLNTSLGWGSAGQSLQYYATLNGIYIAIGTLPANLISTSGFQNSIDIVSMFQEYRIDKISIEMTQGTNNSPINAANTFSNVYAVNDCRDDAPLTSVQAALAYSSCKTVQMGAMTPNSGKQYFNITKPTCIAQAESAVSATGLAPAMLKVSPWMATTYSNVPHYGVKLYNDFIGGAASTIYCTFVFRMFVSARMIA